MKSCPFVVESVLHWGPTEFELSDETFNHSFNNHCLDLLGDSSEVPQLAQRYQCNSLNRMSIENAILVKY